MGEVRDKKCHLLAASMIKRSTQRHWTIFLMTCLCLTAGLSRIMGAQTLQWGALKEESIQRNICGFPRAKFFGFGL